MIARLVLMLSRPCLRRKSTLARRQKSRSRWGVWERQNLCRAHPNAGQLVIGKSSSPARCAGRSHSDFAENDIQIAVARKLQVPVVIATRLAAKSAVLVRGPILRLFRAPQVIREVEGKRAGRRFARSERLGPVKKYQKMDRGKKTGDLRDDFINVLGCR